MMSCGLEYLKLVDFWHFLDLSLCKMCLQPTTKGRSRGGTIRIYIYMCVHAILIRACVCVVDTSAINVGRKILHEDYVTGPAKIFI